MDMSNKRRLISLVNEYVAEDILYSYYCLLSTVFLWVLGYFLLLYDVPFYLKVAGAGGGGVRGGIGADFSPRAAQCGV
ncbi:hypothetical protein, partial [Serratia marcescens]|uniref:hypothetical protein n=1 Tax=Serratia marcescens TaxID=615 RepID=UPI001CAA8337